MLRVWVMISIPYMSFLFCYYYRVIIYFLGIFLEAAVSSPPLLNSTCWENAGEWFLNKNSLIFQSSSCVRWEVGERSLNFYNAYTTHLFYIIIINLIIFLKHVHLGPDITRKHMLAHGTVCAFCAWLLLLNIMFLRYSVIYVMSSSLL